MPMLAQATMIDTLVFAFVLIALYRLFGWCWKKFWLWLHPTYLTMQEERFFEEALANVNSELPVETRRRPDGFVATCVNDAKNEFGPLTRTTANRRMVHKFLRDKFRECPDFRPKNIQDVLPLAIEMVFTASDGEILARKYRASKAAQDREEVSLVRWLSLGVSNPRSLGFADE